MRWIATVKHLRSSRSRFIKKTGKPRAPLSRRFLDEHHLHTRPYALDEAVTILAITPRLVVVLSGRVEITELLRLTRTYLSSLKAQSVGMPETS